VIISTGVIRYLSMDMWRVPAAHEINEKSTNEITHILNTPNFIISLQIG